MKVEMYSGCIGCGACETLNSEVFLIDKKAFVLEENITGNEDDARLAAMICPVGVINIDE